ncbi:MAG: lysophospholipid acyltransferase family protein, partial [Gemmatimonadaceae bacterium]
VLFALWHGQMLPLLWHHREEGIAVLVSEHRDGESIATVLGMLGYTLIRGSTSRGAGRALLGLVRTLRSGVDAAITPDGPRGPRHQFAAGALIAANRANAPILPIVAHVDRYWQLSSWDGFIIPKPFARVTVAYGPATMVHAETPREAAEEAPRLERIMSEALKVACG